MHMSFVHRREKGNMEKGQWDVIQHSVGQGGGGYEDARRTGMSDGEGVEKGPEQAERERREWVTEIWTMGSIF